MYCSPESTDEIAADPDVWTRGYMRGAFSHSGGDIWDCLVMILSLDLTASLIGMMLRRPTTSKPGSSFHGFEDLEVDENQIVCGVSGSGYAHVQWWVQH